MKEKVSCLAAFTKGLIKENPVLVMLLGTCPTLAITTMAVNGLGMGLATTFVLVCSNVVISLLKNYIPKQVRLPSFIVIIAGFVTFVSFILQSFLPDLYSALGVFLSLITVNCIILGRAESYAYTNGPVPSLFDGIGMGLGFTVALTCIGAVRELLGAGEIFGARVMPQAFTPIGIFVLAPGAFFVLAALCALQNLVKIRGARAGKDTSKIGSGCSEDCMNCGEKGCGRRKFYDDSDDLVVEDLSDPADA